MDSYGPEDREVSTTPGSEHPVITSVFSLSVKLEDETGLKEEPNIEGKTMGETSLALAYFENPKEETCFKEEEPELVERTPAKTVQAEPGRAKGRPPADYSPAEDYMQENQDFSVEEVAGQKMLICKFCKETVPISAGKTANLTAEHLASKTHLLFKKQPNCDSLHQLSLTKTLTSFKRKREEEKDVVHEFARALVKSGTSLHQIDGPIGNLFRRCAPMGTTMPTSTEMHEKYLPELFLTDVKHISELLHGDVKISVTIDESLEMHGDPAMAVLFTFCDSKNGWVRRTLMADVDIAENCNAVLIGVLLQKVLCRFNKNLSDIVLILIDSPAYMKAVCDDLSKGMPEFKPFLVRDPCRMLDGMLESALKSSELMRNTVDFVVCCGAVFRDARELKHKYFLFCAVYGMKDRMIPDVCSSWWFSVLDAVSAILSMWRPFTEFILRYRATGKKCEDIRSHIDSELKKSTVYCILTFLKENTAALVDITKKLECENTLVSQVYRIIAADVKILLESKLGEAFNDFGPATCALLECLPLEKRRAVEKEFRTFYLTMHEKWLAVMHRNLPSATLSRGLNDASLWYSVQVLDPFRKGEFSPDFEKYRFIFHRFSDTEAISTQFNSYVAEPVPENSNLIAHQYWQGKLQQWPELANCALAVLALPVSSTNVERTFSQMQNLVQRKEQAGMIKDLLKKYCMLYYNKFDV
ncbi:uncharacterized protein [Pleurodeles waltl]|uniref:uncharacterized protein isoform X2 n=1 Tax=Pleurodeles waltl TaxID=8319 RepID=UPI0037099ACF